MSNELEQHDPLDPRVDPTRWERLVASIVEEARPELERRAASASPVVVLSRWSRPILAMAASLVAVAGTTILATWSLASQESVPSFAETLVPATVATWLEGGGTPTLEELVFSLEGEDEA